MNAQVLSALKLSVNFEVFLSAARCASLKANAAGFPSLRDQDMCMNYIFGSTDGYQFSATPDIDGTILHGMWAARGNNNHFSACTHAASILEGIATELAQSFDCLSDSVDLLAVAAAVRDGKEYKV